MPGFDPELERRAARVRAESAALRYDSGREDDRSAMVDQDLLLDRPADRSRGEVVVPEFAGHPLPEVARFLWLMARESGTAPPWNVRVSPALCAKYGMRRVAIALHPHAAIVMTPDGRHPAPMLQVKPAPLADDPKRMVPRWVIEFNYGDQPGGASLAPAVEAAPAGALWVPDSLGRTSRTI